MVDIYKNNENIKRFKEAISSTEEEKLNNFERFKQLEKQKNTKSLIQEDKDAERRADEERGAEVKRLAKEMTLMQKVQNLMPNLSFKNTINTLGDYSTLIPDALQRGVIQGVTFPADLLSFVKEGAESGLDTISNNILDVRDVIPTSGTFRGVGSLLDLIGGVSNLETGSLSGALDKNLNISDTFGFRKPETKGERIFSEAFSGLGGGIGGLGFRAGRKAIQDSPLGYTFSSSVPAGGLQYVEETDPDNFIKKSLAFGSGLFADAYNLTRRGKYKLKQNGEVVDAKTNQPITKSDGTTLTKNEIDQSLIKNYQNATTPEEATKVIRDYSKTIKDLTYGSVFGELVVNRKSLDNLETELNKFFKDKVRIGTDKNLQKVKNFIEEKNPTNIFPVASGRTASGRSPQDFRNYEQTESPITFSPEKPLPKTPIQPEPITVADLEEYRKALSQYAFTQDGADNLKLAPKAKQMINKAIEKIDALFDNLGDITGGKYDNDVLLKARASHQTFLKFDLISNIIAEAVLGAKTTAQQQDRFRNGIKNKILKPNKSSVRKLFTEEEIKNLTEYVKGNQGFYGSIMNTIKAFSPTRGIGQLGVGASVFQPQIAPLLIVGKLAEHSDNQQMKKVIDKMLNDRNLLGDFTFIEPPLLPATRGTIFGLAGSGNLEYTDPQSLLTIP